MFYGIGEIIRNIYSKLYTQLFWPSARLVRVPFYVRNKRYVHLGKNFTCGYSCRISAGNTSSCEINIGRNFTMGDYCQIEGQGGIEIGNGVLLASRVFISSTSHGSYSGEGRQGLPYIEPNKREIIKEKVTIGDNVWIGNNVSVLKGCHIGNGSIIGAGAVVTHDIPANCVAVGAPAKVVKIFDITINKWREI